MVDQRAGAPSHGAEPADQHPNELDTDGTEYLVSTTPDPRTTIGGRYAVDLESPPAAAGIAVAHRGRDLRTRDPVTVKTLRLEYRGDPEMRARFRREARLLQFLSHPNVIRALAFTEERGAPWLVLEHVRGRSLREDIEDRAPLSPEDTVPLLQGLAAALDHLHARGLAHLDVRPENVVVTPDGDVKLVDFGLAQASGTTQQTEGIAHDPDYLAPEQSCGEPVSAATDVFALGCVVYELLTGKPPFVAENGATERNTTIRARLEQSPVPPTVLRENGVLPLWVDDVVLGALERDPRQRYGSAGSFAAMFRSGVEGQVDVETGRPIHKTGPARGRQIPVNEPGIAMKGSPRLASRRAEPEVAQPSQDQIVEATFSPLAKPALVASPHRRGIDVAKVSRRLWLAVIVAVVLNAVLVTALFLTRGAVPGVWAPAASIGPGAQVQVAGTGLVARQAPDSTSPIVANLPEGGTVRITGEPVSGDGGSWWPVEVETVTGSVKGYVPQAWVQGP